MVVPINSSNSDSHEREVEAKDDCPRIFLSADLVGSTALKYALPERITPNGKNGRNHLEAIDQASLECVSEREKMEAPIPQAAQADDQYEDFRGQTWPRWMGVLKKFYSDFTVEYKGQWKRFGRGCAAELKRTDSGYNLDPEALAEPRLWKTLGDELIFVAEVRTAWDVLVLVYSFVEAVKEVRSRKVFLENSVDIKATAWYAGFPQKNGMLNLTSLNENRDDLEDDEKQTSVNSTVVDFLGPAMDAGFRISKFSNPSKMPLSVELALTLALGIKRYKNFVSRLGKLTFGYDGRESLKGVLRGNPYPVLWVDLVSDRVERKLLDSERKLLPHGADIEPHMVIQFCSSYIRFQKPIGMPFLPGSPGFFDGLDEAIVPDLT